MVGNREIPSCLVKYSQTQGAHGPSVEINDVWEHGCLVGWPGNPLQGDWEIMTFPVSKSSPDQTQTPEFKERMHISFRKSQEVLTE